jgi:hypothetical protein
MQIFFNILAGAIGLIFVVGLVFGRGEDIPIVSYLSAIIIILLCVASILFSYHSQSHKLLISAAPVVLAAVLIVPVVIQPYFLLTKFYAFPGVLLEKGLYVFAEAITGAMNGNEYKNRILEFKKKFPPAYTCSKKRSGVVEKFLVKNETRNALIQIEFSRRRFWATPVGLIQGDTLKSYFETDKPEFRGLYLESCYDVNGKSVLDHYKVISNPEQTGYAPYDTQMYETAYQIICEQPTR